MFGGASPSAVARRFTAIAQAMIVDGPAERADRSRRTLLQAIGQKEPATLGEVASAVRRGAPAISRAVDSLVRAGLVERAADPDNRRRLALRLTADGRAQISAAPKAGGPLEQKLAKIAPSELRAVERALEILERATGL